MNVGGILTLVGHATAAIDMLPPEYSVLGASCYDAAKAEIFNNEVDR